ncbi:NUDIX domain-containing protein [Paenibacillus sp. CF384]|uniref:NUDIX domain-containing protein n=1 Tax=Paenibacillus sp. CF384 TaxID=1884382 RepID=UPI00089B2D44|nr:NUDIX domain-containing protein [Paenibacillus sp. CF384]SDW22316.1 NUDIX domain-containing protein [Paenibacillus sp. CF384]
MSRPQLRAEVIIMRQDGLAILVQCDKTESFYRFPGGGVEFGETASEAIQRELIEEFDLQSDIGSIACLNESIVEFDGNKRHDCTIIHWGSINEAHIQETLIHKEREEIILTWRTFEQLKLKPLYPEGILSFLNEKVNSVSHLVIRKNYDESRSNS